jgi:hypothetical protein
MPLFIIHMSQDLLQYRWKGKRICHEWLLTQRLQWRETCLFYLYYTYTTSSSSNTATLHGVPTHAGYVILYNIQHFIVISDQQCGVCELVSWEASRTWTERGLRL